MSSVKLREALSASLHSTLRAKAVRQGLIAVPVVLNPFVEEINDSRTISFRSSGALEFWAHPDVVAAARIALMCTTDRAPRDVVGAAYWPESSANVGATTSAPISALRATSWYADALTGEPVVELTGPRPADCWEKPLVTIHHSHVWSHFVVREIAFGGVNGDEVKVIATGVPL